MSAPPIPMAFDGAVFRPLPGFARKVREHYGAGEVVDLAPVEERSAASHRHYFAAIREAWQNLPEHLAHEFSSPEVLRKKALIKAGYRDERSIVCASKAEADRLAAFVRPMDEFAIISAVGATLIILTAKSQSQKAMGKEVFQASKDAVLDILSDLLGVEAGDMRRHAEAA